MSDNTPQTDTDSTAVQTAEPNSRAASRDEELELYRSLLEPPKEFRNGFTWTAVAGAFFCGLLMMPGAIYLSLMTGGGITANWVTLIIFTEVSRRAMKTLNTQELVVLLYVAGSMSMGGPFMDLIYRQYMASSDTIRDIGLVGQFPSWFVPLPTSDAITGRNLFHADWLVPILLIVIMAYLGRVCAYTLGYFLFRLTSDIEKLPFPFAPIGAQGAMALAESNNKETTWKWRVFSTGAIIGLIYAAVQIGIPLITGALLTKPIQIIPLPWYDSTIATEKFLPATPTGITLDLGLVLFGLIIPFWAVIGSGVAVVMNLILNPILHNMGVLTRWHPGMDTIHTSYQNNIDFWMSFTIGTAAGIAIVSISRTIIDIVRKSREAQQLRKSTQSTVARQENIWDVPANRGDFSPWLALVLYFIASSLICIVCYRLVPRFNPFFLVFFTFLYTPLISYINAKLIGVCGQSVNIPFIREGAYILSGFKGVEIWLAPIPVADYGGQAQNFRVTELTGTNFWSYVKADLLTVPLGLVLSFVFWMFIWHASAIPSENFPFAQKMWDLQAKNSVIFWTATLDTGAKGTSLFYQAFHPPVIIGAGIFTIIAFLVLQAFSLPTMAVYGFLQGIGAGMPHSFIPIIIGALIGKFYLHKRYGHKRFLQMAPVLTAGYGVGVGLIALMGVAIVLIKNAISAAPF